MMHAQKGIPLRERRYFTKVFTDVFSGSEKLWSVSEIIASDAIDWMLNNLPIRLREEAASFAQKLLEGGYIEHVSNKTMFKDDQDLYRFSVSIENI